MNSRPMKSPIFCERQKQIGNPKTTKYEYELEVYKDTPMSGHLGRTRTKDGQRTDIALCPDIWGQIPKSSITLSEFILGNINFYINI